MIGRDGNKQDARKLTEEIEAATSAAVVGGAMEGRLDASGNPGVEGGATRNLGASGAGLGREAISTMDNRVLGNNMAGGGMLENSNPAARALGNGAAILGAAGERRAIYSPAQSTEAVADERGMRPEGEPERRTVQERVEIVEQMAEVDNGYGKEYIPGVMTAENESPYEIAQREQLEAVNRKNEDHPDGSPAAQRVARDQEEHGRVAKKVVDEKFMNKDFELWDLLTWYGTEQNGTLNDLENPHPVGKGNG